MDTSCNLAVACDQVIDLPNSLSPVQTHSGSVWRVTWAHPEFGQVLASCSFDRTAAVWEEIVGESNDKQRGLSHWVGTAVIPQLSVETLKSFTFMSYKTYQAVSAHQSVILVQFHLTPELPFCSVFRSREPRWWTVALQ